MTSESVLNRVVENKWRHPGHLLKLSNRFTEILFLKMIQIESVELLKNCLQITFQSPSSFLRVRQILEHLTEFRDGCHPHFIPIKKLLLTLCHTLVCKIRWGILEK